MTESAVHDSSPPPKQHRPLIKQVKRCSQPPPPGIYFAALKSGRGSLIPSAGSLVLCQAVETTRNRSWKSIPREGTHDADR